MFPRQAPRQASLHWRQIEGRPSTITLSGLTPAVRPPGQQPYVPNVGRFSKTWNGSDDTWDLSVFGVTTISQVLLLTRSGRALTETLDYTFAGAVVQMLNRDDASHLSPPSGEESDVIVVY